MKTDYQTNGLEIIVNKDTVEIELMYPRSNPIQFIECGLCDVRAADNVRVSYDFDKDGWKIEQHFDTELKDEWGNPLYAWKEVYFAQAWAGEKENEL